MKNGYKQFALFAGLNSITLLLCLILILSGAATPFISCFAVDEANHIYIGTQKGINVYADGILVSTINPQTSRAYMFTIENERIVLSTSTKLYIMDLDGNILDTQKDLGADMYNKIQYNKGNFLSHDGDEYTLIYKLGWTRIVKNGRETVFQISLLSVLVKFLIAACAVTMFVFPLRVVIKQNKTRSSKNRVG